MGELKNETIKKMTEKTLGVINDNFHSHEEDSNEKISDQLRTFQNCYKC